MSLPFVEAYRLIGAGQCRSHGYAWRDEFSCRAYHNGRVAGKLRQRGEALELAADESEAHGLQYICIPNSDNVFRNEFSPGFQIEDYIRLRLTDADVTGYVMGVMF